MAAPAGGPPTAAVVCAVGCLAGDREAALGGADFAGSATAMQTALEELAAARAEDALAFELFWVPGDDSEALGRGGRGGGRGGGSLQWRPSVDVNTSRLHAGLLGPRVAPADPQGLQGTHRTHS